MQGQVLATFFMPSRKFETPVRSSGTPEVFRGLLQKVGKVGSYREVQGQGGSGMGTQGLRSTESGRSGIQGADSPSA